MRQHRAITHSSSKDHSTMTETWPGHHRDNTKTTPRHHQKKTETRPRAWIFNLEAFSATYGSQLHWIAQRCTIDKFKMKFEILLKNPIKIFINNYQKIKLSSPNQKQKYQWNNTKQSPTHYHKHPSPHIIEDPQNTTQKTTKQHRDITKKKQRQDRDTTETQPRHDRDILGQFFCGACTAPGHLIYKRFQNYYYLKKNNLKIQKYIFTIKKYLK